MIDTHAHYDDPRFAENLGGLFCEMRANGVKKILTCATGFHDMATVLDIAQHNDGVYAAIGVYPHETHKYSWDEDKFINYAMQEKCVAIGEIGLDYHYDDSPRSTQKEWFIRQLDLANRLGLPVTMHDREAHGDFYDILRAHTPKGAVHCFSGSVETARETVKLGLYIGVGGVVTFKNARILVDVVKDTPIERILLETDAPYMAPEPHRGKTNRSDYIVYIARRIAEIKGIDVDTVMKMTDKNAEELFFSKGE